MNLNFHFDFGIDLIACSFVNMEYDVPNSLSKK